jgi:hypothetical protein
MHHCSHYSFKPPCQGLVSQLATVQDQEVSPFSVSNLECCL